MGLIIQTIPNKTRDIHFFKKRCHAYWNRIVYGKTKNNTQHTTVMRKTLKMKTTCKGESEWSSWLYRQKLRLWMASSVDRIHLRTASFQLILHFYCELANLSKWICAYLFQLDCSRYQWFLLRKKVTQLLVFSLNSLTARTTKYFFLKLFYFTRLFCTSRGKTNWHMILHASDDLSLASHSQMPYLELHPFTWLFWISWCLVHIYSELRIAVLQMSSHPYSRMHPNLRCMQDLHL